MPDKPRPKPKTAADDIRRMMFLTWGALVESGWLNDVERLTDLFGVVADPYRETALGHLSDIHKARLCIDGLLETRQWEKAYRAIARLPRVIRDFEQLRQEGADGEEPNIPPPPPKPTPAPAKPAPAPAPPTPDASSTSRPEFAAILQAATGQRAVLPPDT